MSNETFAGVYPGSTTVKELINEGWPALQMTQDENMWLLHLGTLESDVPVFRPAFHTSMCVSLGGVGINSALPIMPMEGISENTSGRTLHRHA